MSMLQNNWFSKQPLCLKYSVQNEVLANAKQCLQMKEMKSLSLLSFLLITLCHPAYTVSLHGPPRTAKPILCEYRPESLCITLFDLG